MSSTALVADIVPASCVDGPGNRFVVFLQGCTFNCLACHNPQTIARAPRAGPADRRRVDDIVDEIAEVAPFLSGVTVSGGEATCQWHAVHELFQELARRPATRRLTRLVDTNGDADPIVWDALGPVMHGAMVDLKALDPTIHQFLTGRPNDRVLASIRQLDALHRLHEVRLLVIPSVNDSRDQMAATARWLGALTSQPDIAVQGFRSDGTRPAARAFRDARQDDLEVVVSRLVDGGLPRERIRVAGVTTSQHG
jgi:pyruvate-formate lyase-activating enzyme